MPEGGLLAVQAVSEVVVKPVVGEALVDGQPDVVEAGDLHDGLAAVVVEGVEGGVADHLEHQHHGLVRDVAAGHVVAEQGDL